jgi:hypothetical protein
MIRAAMRMRSPVDQRIARISHPALDESRAGDVRPFLFPLQTAFHVFRT